MLAAAREVSRMLRAARFSVRFGFEIEKESMQAIENEVGNINEISVERIREEFGKMFGTGDFKEGVKAFLEKRKANFPGN